MDFFNLGGQGTVRERKTKYYHAVVTGYVTYGDGVVDIEICQYLDSDMLGVDIFDSIETDLQKYFADSRVEDTVSHRSFMVAVKSWFGDRIGEDDVEVNSEIKELDTLMDLVTYLKVIEKDTKVYGFIVEGVNDKDKITSLVDYPWVVVTEGTKYNNRIHDEIQEMVAGSEEVFILTDPDIAGGILAEMILNHNPMLRRIELREEECKCFRGGKVKIGVEHASDDYLLGVLSTYMDRG